jgi:hypothetical protein
MLNTVGAVQSEEVGGVVTKGLFWQGDVIKQRM